MNHLFCIASVFHWNRKDTICDFAAKRDEIREQLLQSQKQQLFGLFVNNVRDQMEKSGKIKVNQEEMKALTHPQTESGV